MKLNNFLKTCTLMMVMAFFMHCEDKKQPNVILFLVDDLGWKDLSSYGSDLYQTPNADSLAIRGVKFTEAYAACTVCSPTRASILTGKYPARLRCTDWISGHQRPYARYTVPKWTKRLQPEEQTIAESLKSRGYSTVHIGKWHLGEKETDWPEHHGFDENIGGWKMGMPNMGPDGGGYFSPYRNPRLIDGEKGEYLTERLTNEAVGYIREHANDPFFMNFWLYNVHAPLQAKEEKVGKYDKLTNPSAIHQNATYAAMVEHMDEALGAVVAQLKREGIYENTIIIFASDNGGLLDAGGGMATSNLPLRSGKGDMYEGGVRVPYIVSWPNQIESGKISYIPTTSADIYPTVMGLLGHDELISEEVDGLDLSNYLLSGAGTEERPIFWHYPHYHIGGATPYSAVRMGDWKLVQIYGDETTLLYNLKSDIGEKNNLSGEYPEKARELEDILKRWKIEVNAQEPALNIDHDPEKAHIWGSGI